MPEVTGFFFPARSRRITLNSDGNRHPVLNSLAAFTLVIGVLAFALSLVVDLHFIATLLGLAGVVVGMYAQMISATREERVIIVTGIIGAGVGVGLGIAHGGFSF